MSFNGAAGLTFAAVFDFAFCALAFSFFAAAFFCFS